MEAEFELRNKKILLIITFLIFTYWFYICISWGYLLSKLFYNLNRTSFYQGLEFHKKINLKKIKKWLILFFKKFKHWFKHWFKNWFKRIRIKWNLVRKSVDRLIKAVLMFRENFKSILQFRHNVRLVKILFSFFLEALLLFKSFVNELFLLNHLIKFAVQCQEFILLLMSQYRFLTIGVYVLYLLLLGLLGLVLGFLLHIHHHEDDIYVFTLLLFLEILYNHGLKDILLKSLEDLYPLETSNAELFSKFSLETIQQTNSRPLKVVLEKASEKRIPAVLGDPFISIEMDFSCPESKAYKFELFKFYKNVNQKVKVQS